MIYLLRILALPGFIIIHAVLLLRLMYQWVAYGGELDVYGKDINKKTLVDLYKRVDDFHTKLDDEYVLMSKDDCRRSKAQIDYYETLLKSYWFANPDHGKIKGAHDEDEGETLQGDG